MKTPSSVTTAIAALSLLSLAACNPSASTVDDNASSSSVSMQQVSSGPYLEETDSSEDRVELDVNVRVITAHVGDWYFTPDTINIKKGEKVQIQVTGDDGVHGFGISELGINVRVEAGKTVTIDIPTDKVGTFTIKCTIPCGSGHRDMKATIVISE